MNTYITLFISIFAFLIAIYAMYISVQNRNFANPATGIIRGVKDIQLQNGFGITTATAKGDITSQPYYGPEFQIYGTVDGKPRRVNLFLKNASYPNGLGVVFAGQKDNFVVNSINKATCKAGEWC